MFQESHPLVRRALRLLALPYCYFKLVNWKECTSSRWQVVKDLLYIFFVLKYYPDNYSPCRLWEKDRKTWVYYYGSSYNSYPRKNLRNDVQRYEYQILFNDKLVCEQLCKGMDVIIPKSYGVIHAYQNPELLIQSAFNQSNIDKLIIKPILGHAGRGIDLAIREDNKIFIISNNKKVSLADYCTKDTMIVQEVVGQNNKISKIASSSLNTIRVVTLWTKSNEVIVLSASMRFGVGESHVDNWSSGGVAVGVDITNGTLLETAYDKLGNQFTHHPESGVKFNGFNIPYWDNVIKVAEEVQQSCQFYKLIGVDVGISDAGPVLIEVNANSDIVFQEQTAGPLLKNKSTLIEFSKHNLLINKYQKELLNNL